ncbi:MAG: CopD family protein [Steroidobacteraceae bacterium]|jgi:putative copper export protein
MNGVGAWDVAAVIVKAILYAATAMAAGGSWFLAYSGSLVAEAARPRMRQIAAAAAALGVASSLLRIPLLAGSMTGGFAGMFDGGLIAMIWNAGEARSTGTRLLGLTLLAVALTLPRGSRIWSVLAALVAATSFAWIGHAHALRPNVLPTVLVAVHGVCVCFWLGALPPLLLMTHSAAAPELGRVARRFGAIALGVVGILLAAGAGLLCLLLASPAALWDSPYGVALLCKLGLVCSLLGLGALNKWRLTPRLLAADPSAVAALRRSIILEMILGAAILLTTATLTTLLGPARLAS